MRRARSCLLIAPVLAAACADPSYEREVDALGPEVAGVPEGPLHRPGQPCVLCHGERGSAEPELSFGGTVYRTSQKDAVPLPCVTVRFIDSAGVQHRTATNEAGNFYVRSREYAPLWPVWVKLELGGVEVDMTSALSREGSCAACHTDPASPSTVGHVYFAADESELAEDPCR